MSTVFRIVDNELDQACKSAAQAGEPVRCGPKCSECCYLLPAVSWEEAELLADWVEALSLSERKRMRNRIRARAAEMREIASRRPSWQTFSRPTRTQTEIPDSLCNEYFLTNSGCPFLIRGHCSAYPVRPTVCRLHLVSSAPSECHRKKGLEGSVETPKAVERTQKKVLKQALNFVEDGRWGQLAVMVEAVLDSRSSALESYLNSSRHLPTQGPVAKRQAFQHLAEETKLSLFFERAQLLK